MAHICRVDNLIRKEHTHMVKNHNKSDVDTCGQMWTTEEELNDSKLEELLAFATKRKGDKTCP